MRQMQKGIIDFLERNLSHLKSAKGCNTDFYDAQIKITEYYLSYFKMQFSEPEDALLKCTEENGLKTNLNI